MNIKNNVLRRVFSIFLALLMVVTSVYFEAADSYAYDNVPYKWTRVESDEELKSMLIELSGKGEDELDKEVKSKNKNDYNARILIVSQTSDNTVVYLSSSGTNALGGSQYYYTPYKDGINGAKLLSSIYGYMDDGYFYSDSGLDSPFIKLSKMGKNKNSGLTVDFNPDNDTLYTLRICDGEKINDSVPFIGITYLKTIFTPTFSLSTASTGYSQWGTDNPYSIFDFDENGCAKLKYRLYATNTYSSYPSRENDVTSYIYFSESTKIYMSTEQPEEAGNFFIFVGTPTSDEEYLEYKYGMHVDEDPKDGNPYQWTRITSDAQLKEKIIEISGKTSDQLDRGLNANNRNDYNARLLLIGNNGKEYFYFSSNIHDDTLAGDSFYMANGKLNAARPFNNKYDIVGKNIFYTDNGLDVPYIKYAAGSATLLTNPAGGEYTGVADLFGEYAILRSDGDHYTNKTKAFIGTTYTIKNPVKTSFGCVADLEQKNYFLNNPCCDVSFWGENAYLMYEAVLSNDVYDEDYDLLEEECLYDEVEISYVSYDNGAFSVTDTSNNATQFYVYLGVPASKDDYQQYLNDNPQIKKENEKEENTENNGTVAKDTFCYKWTKVKTAESFEETLIDIVSAAVGSEVYSTNKNINNAKDYNARLMIVSAGNNMLFGDGKLSVQKAATEIDVKQDKFYTVGTNYGLPYTKLVENSRGETVDYFSIRLANGDAPAEGSNSFIGVELVGKEYKAAYKSSEDVLNGISENSFTLSFYDASAETVHIQANIAGLGTNRYLSASAKKGIVFENSTKLIGTDDGTFYIFLGQPLTQKEYEDDISGASEKKTPTYEDSTYWKWTRVTSTEELNAAILDRCSTDTKVKTTINQLNQNIADLEDYTARILIVPKIKGDQYIPGWEGNSDASVNLRSFEDAGIQENSDGTLESEDELNTPYIKVVKKFSDELYYGPSDVSGKADNDLLQIVCNPIGNGGSGEQGISYAIRMTGEDGSPKAINKNQSAFLNAWFQLRFGRKADGSWEDNDGHSYTIYTWGNAGYYKNVAGYGESYGWGDLNWYSESGYRGDHSKTSFKFDLAYNPALIDFEESGSAKIHWRAAYWFKYALQLYNYNADAGNYGSYKLDYVNDTHRNLSIFGFAGNGFLYEDVFLRCLADGSAVNGVRENQTFHFTYNMEPYANISSQGDTVLFDIYIGEETTRSSYSGVVGGIDAEFEDTLILEDSIAIPSGKTLTVNEGSTLIINGDVYNWGSIKLNGGTLIVNGCLKCIDAASNDASGYKILADQGAQIVVMPGGSIYCYAKTERARNKATRDYARILLSKNSSLSTYGLVLCNVIYATKSSSITVEHGGILVTNRYRKSADQQVLCDFRNVQLTSLEYIFSSENFKDAENIVGLQLSEHSSIKVYGALFIPKGYTTDGSCTLLSEDQYTKNRTDTLWTCMINW